ncbi:MAG: hypothetical protein ABIT01_19945 [Thermoanaerobaculia bacterium]
MTTALLVPAALSLLVLAAHFLRGGQIVLVAITLGAALLLAVRRPWAARVLQISLVCGTAEWIRTISTLIGDRLADGRPFVRMSVILGAVAAVSLLSALALASRRLTARPSV